MPTELTDTREMLAIHECLRKEFASLPLYVKAVREGDSDRAAVVGGHVRFMAAMLDGHHEAEDVMLWPLLRARSHDDAVVDTMEAQHHNLSRLLDQVEHETDAWTTDAKEAHRAALHTSLIELEKAMLEHLGAEEVDILPVVAQVITPDEFATLGQHARATLAPDQLAIALGMILDDNSAEMGERILDGMPPEARAGFEQFGRPAYAAYRSRLLG